MGTRKTYISGGKIYQQDDDQTAKDLDSIVKGENSAHNTRHENGGDDEISVAGLSGELADNQPPKDHASDHENGGGDEIDVSNLDGLIAITSVATETSNELTPVVSTKRNMFCVTALDDDAEFQTPSGSPANGDTLIIRVLDNGTGRALTWVATYREIGVSLPTTTTASKTMYLGFIYNTADSKWDFVSYTEEE